MYTYIQNPYVQREKGLINTAYKYTHIYNGVQMHDRGKYIKMINYFLNNAFLISWAEVVFRSHIP